MRILILSSCTNKKAVEHPQQLTQADFERGPGHIAERERDLAEHLRPAQSLYLGQQHVRLMRGIEAASDRIDLDLRILSAGYGVIPGIRLVAPYEMTFSGMKKEQLKRWAALLEVPQEVRRLLSQSYDLSLILLGDDYLEACALDSSVELGGPTILFCGGNKLRQLPKILFLNAVALGSAEAKRFSLGLIALKGELGARIVRRVADNVDFAELLTTSNDILGLLEQPLLAAPARRSPAKSNSDVDHVISLPQSWREKLHRRQLSYFIPEWDDLVDPHFDFATDTHSGGSGDWSNEVYAHQMYPEPNYDGILISKVVAEKSNKKEERINRMGVHRFLRVPREFPIMGDCGAFGYINESVPPYTTDEILDYYTRLDFDFGVSIDHLIVSATEAEKEARYDLTIENAAEFLRQHRNAKLPWTPIGAVQGWDAKSYAIAARKCVTMGYTYIGLGGLVRTPTSGILEILQRVHEVIPANVKVHLFGLSRIASMRAFADLGVRSVDSASLLRRAWMGTGQNYLTMDGTFFTAIRIPEAGKSFRAKRMVSEGRALGAEVARLEQRCMQAMVKFDTGAMPVAEVLDVLEDYDHFITPDRAPTRELLRETLEARPWRTCACEICRRDGIQVVIFRGNNRNRRRGFHNTYVFYRLLQKALQGHQIGFLSYRHSQAKQLALFGSSALTDETACAL